MRSARGFTLVEMLAALALLGLLAALVLAGVGTAGITAARARDGDAALDGIATAQRVLRDRISRLRALTRLTSGAAVVDADGTPDTFAFIGSPVDRAAPDALYRYRLTRTPGGDVVLEALSTITELQEGGRPPRWVAVPLVRGARALTIAYFGDDGINGGRRWQGFWSNRPQPPDLLRISVAFPEGDRRVWPDLVVRPRATVNSACRIEPLSGRCATYL